MLTPNPSDPSPSSHRWPVYAGLTLIVLLAVLGSLYWIGRNVVLVGRDSAGHLEQTIFVARALQTPSFQAIFNALTFDDYRPPALYLLTQLPYWIFGRTLDAAQLPNVLLLAVIIVLTFVLARRAMGDGFALFAALLVSLLPMMTAMSRLYYMENLLTTMVLLALWALLSGQGFERRGWALESVRDQVAQGSYFARELVSGDTTLAVFGRPQRPLAALPVRSPWDEVEIADLRGDATVAPGQVLPVEMQMVNRTDRALKLSVRLVSPNGEVVAQNDVAVEPAVRLGLFVPPGAAPGDYQLAAVLYDPATLEPVLDRGGNQLGELAPVHVEQP